MNIIKRLKIIFLGNKNSDTTSSFENKTSKVKELSIDELYPSMTDEEILSAILEKDEDELTSEELWIKLGMTLHNEHLYGRSLAIKELLNNSYQILNDEYGNPFKEPINFTILYFEKFIVDKPDEAEKLLRSAFPLMHQFIYRKISKQQNTIVIENNFDEQIAYDEFMVFCKNIFISLYPEKDIRNKLIKQHFKNLSNDLINFIERE
jgi:hypothetical protein